MTIRKWNKTEKYERTGDGEGVKCDEINMKMRIRKKKDCAGVKRINLKGLMSLGRIKKDKEHRKNEEKSNKRNFPSFVQF